MTASTLPPMPPEAKQRSLSQGFCIDPYPDRLVNATDYLALRSWAEACRADRDALAKDAARYRWLRNWGQSYQMKDWFAAGLSLDEIDAAIDVRIDARIDARIGLPDSSNSQGQEGGT